MNNGRFVAWRAKCIFVIIRHSYGVFSLVSYTAMVGIATVTWIPSPSVDGTIEHS